MKPVIYTPKLISGRNYLYRSRDRRYRFRPLERFPFCVYRVFMAADNDDVYLCPIPGCGAKTRVRNTYRHPDRIMRKRVCLAEAAHVHTTTELRSDRPFTVARSQNAYGVTETWDRKKVFDSLVFAAPDFRSEIIDKFVDDVVAALIAKFDAAEPISTRDIGEEIIWQLRTGKSLTAAARFAAKFYPSRPEPELRVESVGELLQVFTEDFGWKLPARHESWHPSHVKKQLKPGQPDTHRVESFSLEKLRVSLATATKGMLDSAKWRPSHENRSPKDRDAQFIAVLMAAVLERVDGQTTVTSGQLSAACMDVLTMVHPLCSVRYALTAKGLRTVEQILNEVADIARKEEAADRAHTSSEGDETSFAETWDILDKSELVSLINDELSRGRAKRGS